MGIVSFTKRLVQAGLTLCLIVIAAGVLLPWIRVYPEAVHKYFLGLRDWIRIAFIFSLSVVFTGVMFKLLSPRIGHLKHWRNFPPIWLTVLVAFFVVAIIDMLGGFTPNGYRAFIWEWLGYGGGSLMVVSCYFGMWAEIGRGICKIGRWVCKIGRRISRRKSNLPSKCTETVTLQDIENAPWEEIEDWLRSDAPAQYDFLSHQTVADRVSRLISDGIRSVGIVGPFGAGKTTLVKWIIDRLKDSKRAGCRNFVCKHSCWGFETSASAIQDMLRLAVSELNAEIDTFQIDSLPESYRQMFSAGGTWVKAISNLVLRNSGPKEQFSRLSDMLGGIGGRLVFIIEDLDRNDTQNFEIQEVLAFLERIKEYPNLSFILTGGLSSSQRIDYAKLCDHIEYMRTIQPHHSSGLIERVKQHCLDKAVFPHVQVGTPNQNHRRDPWNPLSDMLMRDYEEFSFSQAVALLLNTPRSLRHALGRTFSAWRTLHGEIDFDHLLAINVLRFGAPECFQFLLERWDRLHSPPPTNPSFGKERIERIRKTIHNDWLRMAEKVEWNPVAALRVLEFILPASEYWLKGSSNAPAQNGWQSVSKERYWLRAINEAIDTGDVRDQEVIRDMRDWLDSPGTATELVTKLTSSPQYSDIWENLAGGFFANQRNEILLLCEQVICRILSEQGSSASYRSQGFAHTYRFAYQRVSNHPDNREWVQEWILDAAHTSIEMVNGLWYFCGSEQSSILQREDAEPVRQYILDIVKKHVTDGSSLVTRLTPNTSATLYDLVFDYGDKRRHILVGAATWSWLGSCILEALRDRNVIAAANCGVLLGDRVSGREQITVDTEVLDQFFGDNASEVIDILESMIDQLPEADHLLAKNVVGAARQYLAGRILPNEEENDIDAN